MAPRQPLVITGLLALAVSATAPAQEWRWEKINAVGIKFEACGRLERIPMKFGQSNAHQHARLRPREIKDYINGTYPWYCDVYEFPKPDPKGAQEAAQQKEQDEEEDEDEKKRRDFMERLASMGLGRGRYDSFEDWVDAQQVKLVQKGKARKGRGSRLPYKHWRWTKDGGMGGGRSYAEAAVYDFEDREVALVIQMPLIKRKAKKPSGKWLRYLNHMIQSGTLLKVNTKKGVSSKEISRDKYANTPYRKKQLAAAKKNIHNIKGWDYFTTPNYIVLYAWDFKKNAKRVSAHNQSRKYASLLEKMRQLYKEHYPLDETGTKAVQPDPASVPDPDPEAPKKGPITPRPGDKKPGDKKDDGEQTEEERRAAELAKRIQEALERAGKEAEEEEETNSQEAAYPIFRLCATYSQFGKYGGTRGGVVGWFNPRTKELVVFLGGDRMMGKGATETVVYHEGWHQYADLYFSGRRAKGERLHRWFDEGHGDFFGSYRWKGKWVYKGSKMRHRSVKQMVQKEDHVPFKEIVRWSRRRFYSGKAPYYYAQAYSMIDYFRRGHLLKKRWDQRYGQILDMYRKVILVHGDSKRATDTAFRGFKDEDWKKLEEAWKAWVKSRYFKGGK